MASPSMTSMGPTMSLAQLISIARKGEGYVGALKSAAAHRLVGDIWRRASESQKGSGSVSSSSDTATVATVAGVAPTMSSARTTVEIGRESAGEKTKSRAQLVDDLSVSAWAWAKLCASDSVILNENNTSADNLNTSSSSSACRLSSSPMPASALKDGLRLMRTPKQLSQTVWALGSLGVFGKNDQVVGQVVAQVGLNSNRGSSYQKSLSNSDIADLISATIRQALRVEGNLKTAKDSGTVQHHLQTWSPKDFAQFFSGLAGAKKSVQNPVWTMAGSDLEVILRFLRENVDEIFGEVAPSSRSPHGLEILCVLHFLAEWRVRMLDVTNKLTHHLVQHARAELTEMQAQMGSSGNRDGTNGHGNNNILNKANMNRIGGKNHRYFRGDVQNFRRDAGSRRGRKDLRTNSKRDNLCLDAVRHLSLLETVDVSGSSQGSDSSLSDLIDIVIAREWTKTKLVGADPNGNSQPSSTREMLTLLYAIAMSGYYEGATAARRHIVHTMYRQTCSRFLDGCRNMVSNADGKLSPPARLNPKVMQDLQEVLRLSIAFDDEQTRHTCLALLSGETVAISRNSKLHFTSTGEQRRIAEELRKRELAYTQEQFFRPLWKTVDFAVEVDAKNSSATQPHQIGDNDARDVTSSDITSSDNIAAHRDRLLLVEYDGPHHYYRIIAETDNMGVPSPSSPKFNPSNEGIVDVEHGKCASADINHSVHVDSHQGRQKTNQEERVLSSERLNNSVFDSDSSANLIDTKTKSSKLNSVNSKLNAVNSPTGRFTDTIWGGRFSDANLNSTAKLRITTKTQFETSLMRKLGWKVERLPFYQNPAENVARIAEIAGR